MFKSNEFFEFWTELKPTEFAFVDESHKITYREANIYTKRIATFIKKLGPKPGDVVCLILPN
jgi:non-ribosomal peptide synthetase component E (peptide arylation enzyme)